MLLQININVTQNFIKHIKNSSFFYLFCLFFIFFILHFILNVFMFYYLSLDYLLVFSSTTYRRVAQLMLVMWLSHYWGAVCGAAVAERRVAQVSSGVVWCGCHRASCVSAIIVRRVAQLLLVVAWLSCCGATCGSTVTYRRVAQLMWSSRGSAIEARRVAQLLLFLTLNFSSLWIFLNPKLNLKWSCRGR
jgi:hypothetical protein